MRAGWVVAIICLVVAIGGALAAVRLIAKPLIAKSSGAWGDPSEATACMLGALKGVRGVSEPSVSFSRDLIFERRPFVRYTYPGSNGTRRAVTFAAEGRLADPARWRFVAKISGLYSPGENGPDLFGADNVIELWKQRCAVNAVIEFP
jgi:hypothetical protein